MDNLTHTLFGVAIAKTRLGRGARLALPATLVAANLPDLDAITLWIGPPGTYLIQHRGITHSLVGLVVLALLLTAAAVALERRLARRDGRTAPPLGALAWPIALGLASHLALDGLNTYGVRPFLPFVERWYYGDLVFIADPWLWLLLGSIAALVGRRSRGGSVALAAAAIAALAVVHLSERAPRAVVWSWTGALVLLGLLRASGRLSSRPRAVWRVASLGIAAYLVLLGFGRERALRSGLALIEDRLAEDENLEDWMASPSPGRPLRWTLTADTQKTVYKLAPDADGAWSSLYRLPKNADDPLVQAATRKPEARAWHVFARMPFATATRTGRAATVVLSDGRYQWTEAPGWSSVRVELDAAEVRTALSRSPNSRGSVPQLDGELEGKR